MSPFDEKLGRHRTDTQATVLILDVINSAGLAIYDLVPARSNLNVF